MSLTSDWKERHGPRKNTGKVIWLFVVLLLVILIIMKSREIFTVFSDIFFNPLQNEQPAEIVQENTD